MEKQEKQTKKSEMKNFQEKKPEVRAPMSHQEQEDKRFSEKMVRIMSEDIEGAMKVYPALTKINGVSWSLANAVCNVLKLDKNRKIGSLTEDEIKKITEFMKNPQIPEFLFNRNRDRESGKNMHLTGTNLELQTEFDVKRLKKIKSYKGVRHAAGLPVRGQRTKSHFRKNKTKSMGIKKKGKPEDNKNENFKQQAGKK
jgi:small subunit ribosomal protein S13